MADHTGPHLSTDALVVTISGALGRDAGDWVYVPVDVPSGVSRLDVDYRYDRPDVLTGELGNSCDLRLFNERGYGPGAPGVRGWSGGARTGLVITATDATPGYVPGPINAGRWHVSCWRSPWFGGPAQS